MIQPSIGRTVLFWDSATARANDAQPFPAMICHVWNDRSVSVGGFDAAARPFGHQRVPLLQDDDAPPSTGCFAEWRLDGRQPKRTQRDSFDTPTSSPRIEAKTCRSQPAPAPGRARPFDDADDFSTTAPTVEGEARLVLTDALAVLRFFHFEDEAPLIKRVERLLGADA